MPDYSVTSGTELTLMPECRCRTENVDWTNFFPAFQHLYIFLNIVCTCTVLYVCIQFHPRKVFIMPECRTVRHPVSPVHKWTRLPVLEAVRYRDKGTQSGTGMLRYMTEIHDAGMPMPSESASMPMPSYSEWWLWCCTYYTIKIWSIESVPLLFWM
jgi:hypothetical protein